MQVYRGMDIGTAKPSLQDRARVTHHMVDIVDPEERYTVARFQRDAREVLASAVGPVVITGGSGLHFRSVVDPLRFPGEDPALRDAIAALPAAEAETRLLEIDPEAAVHVDLANPRRVARALEVAMIEDRSPTARAASPQREAVARYQPEFPFAAIGGGSRPCSPGEGGLLVCGAWWPPASSTRSPLWRPGSDQPRRQQWVTANSSRWWRVSGHWMKG